LDGGMDGWVGLVDRWFRRPMRYDRPVFMAARDSASMACCYPLHEDHWLSVHLSIHSSVDNDAAARLQFKRNLPLIPPSQFSFPPIPSKQSFSCEPAHPPPRAMLSGLPRSFWDLTL